MLELKKDKGIVVACDVVGHDHLMRLVRDTCCYEDIVAYKVGFVTCYCLDVHGVHDTIRHFTDKPIIFDHQKGGTDIPDMGKMFADVCGFTCDAAILFPFAGPESQTQFTKSLFEVGVDVITGSFMTHPKFIEDDGGYICNAAPLRIFDKAIELGVDKFVIPGNNEEKIREYVSYISCAADTCCKNPSFFAPGIGKQGGSIKKFIGLTRGYNSYAIVGSAIYRVDDMKEATEKLIEELNS